MIKIYLHQLIVCDVNMLPFTLKKRRAISYNPCFIKITNQNTFVTLRSYLCIKKRTY